jgi:hypothetical protein
MAVGKPLYHLDEVYKRTLLEQSTPRRGDVAEIVRDHHRTEKGALVRVVNDPHECVVYCADCGQRVEGYFVEVEPLEVALAVNAAKQPGPYFMPVAWLKRVTLGALHAA